MTKCWTSHYVNSEQDVNALEDVIKSSVGTRFQICELKFKNKELRELFNTKIKEKFVNTCGASLDKASIDRLCDTEASVWITPYGNIKLSYAEMGF